MKIRMIAEISGLRDGALWPARGAEVEVPDAEGAEMCAAGMAEPVADAEVRKETRPARARAEKRAEAAPAE